MSEIYCGEYDFYQVILISKIRNFVMFSFKLSALSAATLLAILPLSALAQTHSLGDQTPSGWFTTSYWAGNGRGWSFTAGASDIQITQLGIDPVTAGSYTLTLFDTATQSVLAQTTGSAASQSWTWFNLGSAVSLTAGSTYAVIGYGNDSGATYHYGSGFAPSWYPSGVINYVETIYCNGCTANTYPTSSLGGYQYGPVDIGYVQGNVAAVPEPETYAMMLMGLGALGFMGLRRKQS